MITKEQTIAYSEILGVLEHMKPEYVDKIPKELIKFYEDNKSNDYVFEYDINKKFSDQDLTSLGKYNLVNIYNNYIKENSENNNYVDVLKEVIKKQDKEDLKHQDSKVTVKSEVKSTVKENSKNVKKDINASENKWQVVSMIEASWYNRMKNNLKQNIKMFFKF